MSDSTVLVLVGSLRAASVNRQLAELAVETAPAGVTLEWFDRLGELPFYNEDVDTAAVAEPVVALRDGGGRRRCRPGRHARVQRQHSRRAEERHRLAVAAVRQRCVEGQAACGHRLVDGPVRRRVGARRDAQVLRHRRSAGRRGSRSCPCRQSRSMANTRGRTPRSSSDCARSSASWPPRSAEAVSAGR